MDVKAHARRFGAPVSETAGISTAWWLFAYILVVVGRPHELIPALASIPFGKLTFGGALLAAYSDRAALSTRLRDVPLARNALYFLGLASISVLYSIWPINSLKMVLNGLVTLAASFILIVKLGRNWRALRIIVTALPLSALLLALNTLLSYSGVRPPGTSYYDPNDLAFTLVAVFPLICGYALTAHGLRRPMLWGTAFITLIAILLTQSRGGLVGLSLVTLAMSVYSIDPAKARKSGAKRLGIVAANLLLACVIAVAVWHVLPAEARARLATVVSLGDDYNMTEDAGRVSIWKRNVAATLTRPIGFGLGSFEAVDIRTGGRFKAAHNSLVEVFVELGFLGLWLYLRFFFLAWRGLSRALGSGSAAPDGEATPRDAAVCRAFAISLIGILACGFFLTEAFTNLVWAVFSLIAAITAAPPQTNPATVGGATRPFKKIAY